MGQNSNVNGGPTMGGKGGPKDTAMGKDLGRDATNTISTPGANPSESSPSATCMGNGYRKGSKKY